MLLTLSRIIFPILFLSHLSVSQNIISGSDWKDTSGDLIEAHGGGILFHKDVYYWYGEDKSKGNFNKTGVSGYKSTDLKTWKNIGVVLKAESMPDLFKTSTQGDAVLERPKVLYNSKTKKFVMWMHLDANTYTEASAGVAVSDKPEGPFKFLKSFRPIAFKYDYKSLRGEQYSTHEAERGNTYRDMSLFQDDDGKGYVFYSSEDNATMYVSRLSADFTDIERPVEQGKSWSRILVNKQREAPAPFKYKNKYYLITSGLTGWSPNAAMYAVADHILGPYEIKGDPCLGADANSTFFSQSTFVLPVAGAPEGSFVFMADRWNGTELEKSRYVWLPFTVKNGKVSILNIPSWDKSIFDTLELKSFEKSKFSIRYDSVGHQIVWQPLAGAHLYAVIKNGEIVGSTAATSYTIPPSLYGHSFNYQIIAQNIQQKQVFSQNHLVLEDSRAKRISLNSIAPDYYTQGFGILKYNKNMDEGQMVIANKVFENGLGTHPPSVLKYYLGGHYKRLSIGMGHTTTPAPMSKVGFEIRGDGQVIYKSQPMTEANPAVFVDLDISGICELELLVNDGGDGSHYDHAAWVDGVLGR